MNLADTSPLAQQLSAAVPPLQLDQPGSAATLAAEFDGAADRSVQMDLAYDEFCRQLEAGENPDPEQFCLRYPACEASLRKLLIAHIFLEKNPHLVGDRPAVDWPKLGQTFRGFCLLRELGRGTFARVFLAIEPALGGRHVVVKISQGDGTEAETLGRLTHPNIVPVYSVQTDSDSGLTVICMPYLGGATLEHVLHRIRPPAQLPSQAGVLVEAAQVGPLPQAAAAKRPLPALVLRQGTYLDGVLHLAVQLAEALTSVHEQGICHRDLKPSNVLLTPDGWPMLLDFNLSAAKQKADRFLVGTLPYMAPEDLRRLANAGPAVAPDVRSDLFGLGVILYELLTGVHPFAPLPPPKLAVADACRLLLQQHEKGPAPLREANRHVDAALERTLVRCLAFRPEDRPSSAAEFTAELRQALTPVRRARRWLSGHPRRAVLAVAVGAAVAVGVPYAIRATAVVPSNATAHPRSITAYERGLAAYQKGAYQQAVEFLKEALEADRGSPTVRFALGRAYLPLGDEVSIQLALANFSGIDRPARDGKTWACIGYCLSQLRFYEAAATSFNEAQKLGFATAPLLSDLGCCYLLMGGPENLERAKLALDRAVELDRGISAGYRNRAGYYLSKQSYHEGIPDMEEAIRLAGQKGRVTSDLYFEAARLCALAAKFGDKQKQTHALAFLKQAVDAGLDPQQIRDAKFTFSELPQSELRPLAEGSSLATPTLSSSRLLDPLQGLTGE